ncbi:MAG: hypothetical protein IPF47_21515 [Gemmatimonadetes bacterium]|nr:hypothetical protein [Gemmatimonadota bacterium]
MLDGRYRFDNFVIGTANRLAASAARAVAEAPGAAYNPLFIYSASGLGRHTCWEPWDTWRASCTPRWPSSTSRSMTSSRNCTRPSPRGRPSRSSVGMPAWGCSSSTMCSS